MNPGWRIYYSDGSTFDGLQGAPQDAPAYGFICAVGYDETGARYIMHGWDHYCFDTASCQWWGCDLVGMIDRSTQGLMYAHKIGRTVTKTQYQEIMARAHSDPDFPQR